LATACNNSKKEDPLKTQADKLQQEVLDGHDVAMPKSMRIPDIETKVKAITDSLEKLPAKAKEAAAPYKAKLDELSKDLSYASMAMDKWMTEFDMDSFKSNMEQRIKYFTEEKSKVNKVKDAILSSLAKADSLLKK
jgi:hypothetical protein